MGRLQVRVIHLPDLSRGGELASLVHDLRDNVPLLAAIEDVQIDGSFLAVEGAGGIQIREPRGNSLAPLPPPL
jgi:hypothetical protein